MNDPIFDAFLARQLADGVQLAGDSDICSVLPVPARRPRRFIAEFRCAGLAQDRGRVVERRPWAFAVSFPEFYLRQPVDTAQVLEYLGPWQPFHPNISPDPSRPFVCMHLTPGAPLVEILLGLYELVTWGVFATRDDGLNPVAAQWARQQAPQRFPLERRPLRRAGRKEPAATP